MVSGPIVLHNTTIPYPILNSREVTYEKTYASLNNQKAMQ